MITICLPCDSSQKLGGGFSFRRNFIKGLSFLSECKYSEKIEDSDVCLLAGTSMVTRETVDKIKSLNKKLVVRVDGVPRNSNNRNTGTSRLKEFSERADAVIWQCVWAKKYLGDFIKPRKEVTIYNGVDTDVFKPKGPFLDFGERDNVYLYSRYNRDATKNWEVAWYEFQLIARRNPRAKLVLVGKWGKPPSLDRWEECRYDFFRGEKYDFRGVVNTSKEMSEILRGCGHFLATYYNDCFSNTYLEALSAGVKLYKPSMTGGTPELIKHYEKGDYGLKTMAQHYYNFFKSL